MKDKTLVIYKTHVLNRHIFSEYKKLSRSGYDILLVVDNRSNIFPHSGLDIGFTRWNFIFLHYFLTEEKHYRELGLPFISFRGPDDDLGRVLWTNSDYTIYLVRKNFSNYKYYWQFDYDCYFSGLDYSTFFKNYERNTEDLLICNFGESVPEWVWHNKSDWVYKNVKKYMSFFPIVRLSAEASDFLYKKRLEQGKIFEGLYDPECPDGEVRSIFSELFVPTELMNNHFSCASLPAMPGVVYEGKTNNREFYEQKKFLVYDNNMYHPIKDDKYFDMLEEIQIHDQSVGQGGGDSRERSTPTKRRSAWGRVKDSLNPHVSQDSPLRKLYRALRSCCKEIRMKE